MSHIPLDPFGARAMNPWLMLCQAAPCTVAYPAAREMAPKTITIPHSARFEIQNTWMSFDDFVQWVRCRGGRGSIEELRALAGTHKTRCVDGELQYLVRECVEIQSIPDENS